MLRTVTQSISADLDQMVDGLMREDLDFDRKENRTALRESLLRCVSVDPGSGADTIDGFSRNISHTGIGIVTDALIRERRTATLTIERLDGTTIKVLADCRWCKPYGKKWHLSGWQFLNLR